MRKRNFFKYTFTPRALALLTLVFVLCAFVIGLCKVSGYWFLVTPIIVAYLIFCTAYFLKSLFDWIKYRQ